MILKESSFLRGNIFCCCISLLFLTSCLNTTQEAKGNEDDLLFNTLDSMSKADWYRKVERLPDLSKLKIGMSVDESLKVLNEARFTSSLQHGVTRDPQQSIKDGYAWQLKTSRNGKFNFLIIYMTFKLNLTPEMKENEKLIPTVFTQNKDGDLTVSRYPWKLCSYSYTFYESEEDLISNRPSKKARFTE